MGVFSFLDGMQIYHIIILLLGLVFLIIEMFTPGFGVSGSIGLVLLIVGIILTASNLFEALVMFILLLIILGIALTIVLRSATSGSLAKTLILNDSLNREEGFISTEDLKYFIGKDGVTVTILRPSGTAEFDGVKLDVVSDGGYIPKNTKVQIVEVSGRKIVVKTL